MKDLSNFIENIINTDAVISSAKFVSQNLVPFEDFKGSNGNYYHYRNANGIEIWTIVDDDNRYGSLLFAIRGKDFVGFRQTWIHTEDNSYPIRQLEKRINRGELSEVINYYGFYVISENGKIEPNIRTCDISEFSQMLESFGCIKKFIPKN